MRVSTTMIESFRLFMQPDQDWMPESDLLDTIQGIFKPTPKMLLGQAFGRCLEKPAKYRREDSMGEYYAVPVKNAEGRWEEIVFSGAIMRPCLERFDRAGVFEVKTTRQYGEVMVVAKVDQLLGLRIKETKAKLGQFDFDRYESSCQWRFYLDAFEAKVCDYNIFVLGDDEEALRLKSIESFSLYPYARMHDDCMELVGKFVDYVKAKELDGFLRKQQELWG
jgi:hypothetical protein